LPLDQRERFEEVMIYIEPELYEDVYLPFINGNIEPLLTWVETLKTDKEKIAMSIFDEQEKTVLISQKYKKVKRFNLSQTAKVLEVPRQTIYYWIKKKGSNQKGILGTIPFLQFLI